MALSALPAAAFFSLAASDPEIPWLFHPEGLDWRWWSRREVARGALAWAAELARHPPGSHAAFLYRPRPYAVALDLAIQAAGLVSVPLAEEGEAREEGVVTIGGEAVPLGPWNPAASQPAGLPQPGGGAVLAGGGAYARQVGAGGLAAAAERIAQEIAAAAPLRERHEILVSYRPLSDPLERALISWAASTGAAVLLEPFPLSALASIAWARPTLFAGTTEEISRLRAAAGPSRRPWRRRKLPFGRLRLVLAAGSQPLPPEEAAYWEERGVRVVEIDPQTLFEE